MAKLIKTFEKGIDKTELTFMGGTFTVTMIPTDYGSKSIEKSLDIQIKAYLNNSFTDIDTESKSMEEVFDVLDIIDSDEDEDRLDDLEVLDKFEAEVGYHAD